jgi:PAS domain-containing protein
VPVTRSVSFRLGRLLRRRQRARANASDDGQLLRCLLEAAPESLYFKDAASRFLRVSRAMAERWGCAPEDLLDQSDGDFLPAAVAERTATAGCGGCP